MKSPSGLHMFIFLLREASFKKPTTEKEPKMI